MTTIKSKIKNIIYRAIPKNLKSFLSHELFINHEYFKFMNNSFSQEGEDQILSQFFYGVNSGFYIDIGAHHPIKYSNTYKFYLNGWRGINIDAMPGSMSEFNKIRPEDINLEIGISNSVVYLEYFMFEQSGLNTFSKEMAFLQIQNGYKPTQSIEILTIKLEEVLRKYLPVGNIIDFLSLDVEGFELEVLKSNNWTDFRPKIILVESLRMSNKELFDNFFNLNNYGLIAQTVNNLFYADLLSDFTIKSELS